MLLQLGNLLVGQVQQGLAHMSSCHTAEGKDVFKDGHVSAKLHQLDQLGSGHLRLAGSLQITALECLVDRYKGFRAPQRSFHFALADIR